MIDLIYLNSIPLTHHEDCSLLGVTPELTIYAEELYDDWTAWHKLLPDGTILESHDENYGKTSTVPPVKLPPQTQSPTIGSKHTLQLNYTGARHRGLREPERIMQAVRPITLQSKMELVSRLNLDIMPPHVLGLAESYVLSEAEIIPAQLYMVCRRVRIAYALPQQKLDHDHQPYDYDTVTMHIAHLYDPSTYETEVTVAEALQGLPGVTLQRPMDCVIQEGHLFIAEGGSADQPATIHIWQLRK